MKPVLLAIICLIFFGIIFGQEKKQKELPPIYLTSQGMPMIYVKGGTYMMGTDKKYKTYINFNIELGPAHEVTLSPFYMAKYEITKGMFKEFVKETGIAKANRHLDPESAKLNDGGPSYKSAPSDEYPMPNLNWHQAKAFCDWLSIKEKRNYRLPTEAEWEYVARAGTDTLYSWSGGQSYMLFAHRYTSFDRTAFPYYSIRGNFPANPWGFYDLYANVSEWTTDNYAPYKKTKQENPIFLNNKEPKVLRGGHNGAMSVAINSFYRIDQKSDDDDYGGIRLVCVIDKAFKVPDPMPPLKIVSKPPYEVKIHGTYEVALNETVKIKMIKIPEGKFKQGSPEDEKFHYPSESPQFKVEFDEPFWMSETEITQEQYEALLGYNPSEVKNKDLPVTNITWWEAMYYVKKLTEVERKAGRLSEEEEYRVPIEGEWEYACRAGTKTSFYYGNDLDLLHNYAWFDSLEGLQKPKQKFPNPWGLYDMMGNVSEITYNNSYNYEQLQLKSFSEEKTKGGLIFFKGNTAMYHCRGGAWNLGFIHCRSAMRGQFANQTKYNFVGMRLVKGKKIPYVKKTEAFYNEWIPVYFERHAKLKLIETK